jgi:sec-independent protein translocase protein TatC
MSEKEMSFWDHLEELRWVFLRVGIAILAFSIIGFILTRMVFDSVVLAATSSDFITYRFFARLTEFIPFLPDFELDEFSVEMINLGLVTQFMTWVKVSLMFGFLCTIPYILDEVWRFISPALYVNEAKGVKTAFGLGGVMFVIGCLVGYFVVFPFIFRYLITFSLSDVIANTISLEDYMSKFFTLIFIMGLAFEMPLVFWLLSKLGLVYRSLFRKYRRHAIVGCAFLAAIIAPGGDPFSMFIVWVPLYILWEISAFIVRKDPVDEEENLPSVVE